MVAGIVFALSFMNTAWAELVVVVSSENSTTELSRAELSGIFLGRRSRFPNGDSAVPLNQRANSDAYTLFYMQYLNMTRAQVRSHWSRLIFTGRGQPPRTVPNGSTMADAIADDARGIGYLDIELVDERLRVVRIE